MELTQTPSRIHPLMAGAAVSVTLVSLLGVAALSGLLPTSHGSAAPLAETSTMTTSTMTTPASSTTMPLASNQLSTTSAAQNSNAPVLVKTASGYQYMQPVGTATTGVQTVAGTETVTHTAPQQHAHHHHFTQTYAQADTGYRGDARQPVYQQAPYQAPQRANSPVGIATGAVVGGLLGSQIGGGNGRTLATVAGAVGGGYLGNIAGQKYGY